MKYDSFDDFFFFVVGASIASGRTFWAGKNTPTNKYLVDTDNKVSISVSEANGVRTTKVRKLG